MTMNYCVYGINMSSNIQIDYVATCENKVNLRLNVDYNYNNPRISSISITELDESVNIDLNPFAHYRIDYKNNEITCSAQNYESFFSTFFNIPLSAYLILKGEILLHASSMSFADNLICFAGEKGVGKSTLINLLNGDQLMQYSDDTLRIDYRCNGYKGNNLSKLKDDSVEKLCVKDLTGYRNAVGKQYVKLSTDFSSHQVKALVCLCRTDSGVELNRVSSEIAKRSIIFDNIVGLNYFTSSMVKKALKAVNNINIPVFTLKVPNNLHQLIMMKERLINMIKTEV